MAVDSPPMGASSSPRRAAVSRSSTTCGHDPDVFADLSRTSTTAGTGACSGWRCPIPGQIRTSTCSTRTTRTAGTAPQYGTTGGSSDLCPDGARRPQAVGERPALEAATLDRHRAVLINDWCQQFPSHSIGDARVRRRRDALRLRRRRRELQRRSTTARSGADNPCTDPPNEGGAIRSQDPRTTPPDREIRTLDGACCGSTRPPARRRRQPADRQLAICTPAGSSRTACATRSGSRSGPGTNEVWLGDVGWNAWEEINRVRFPTDSTLENFGWPATRGGPPASARQSGYRRGEHPVCETLYPDQLRVCALLRVQLQCHRSSRARTARAAALRSQGWLSTEGGSYPDNYDGALSFSDYSRGCIWVMFPGGNGLPDPNNRATFVDRSPTPRKSGPRTSRSGLAEETSSTPTTTAGPSAGSSTSASRLRLLRPPPDRWPRGASTPVEACLPWTAPATQHGDAAERCHLGPASTGPA